MFHGVTALYLRKSTEDDNGNGVSESIENQELFNRDYCKQNEFAEIKVYIDDGYSGTNFNRPGFCALLKDIESGIIDTVITKDYSRLGRNYIQTGYYCEHYFPEHNVRYIAINDGIDTSKSSGNNDMAPFRAVFNDMYAKDISIKVRSSLTAKKKNGKFIGAVPPYGYKKSDINKNVLVIDEDTACYVRMIFNLALKGDKLLFIANKLTELGIPTPSESKNLNATQKRFKGVWNEITIRNILTNETYIGNLTQNRTKKISYKVNKKNILPKKEWITVNNTHEPIIDTESFYIVNQILKVRTYSPKKGKANLLSGLCCCAECMSPMTYHNSGDIKYLVCSAWKKHAALNLCTSHSIREDFIVGGILNLLKKYAKDINISDINLDINMHKPLKLSSILTDKIEKEKHRLFLTYKDKTNNVISDEDYQFFASEIKKAISNLETQLSEINEEDTNPSASDISDYILKLLQFEEIDRESLLILVNKIIIGNEKNITVEFNFKEPK